MKLGRIGIALMLLPATYGLLNWYFQGGVEGWVALQLCGDPDLSPTVPTFDRYGCGFDLSSYVVWSGVFSVAAGALILFFHPPRF